MHSQKLLWLIKRVTDTVSYHRCMKEAYGVTKDHRKLGTIPQSEDRKAVSHELCSQMVIQEHAQLMYCSCHIGDVAVCATAACLEPVC